MIAGAREALDRRPWLIDLLLMVAVTACAGALRLALLGDIPYGLHPDEAQVGTDARRILDGEWIGVYTEAALGQPAGHAYISAPAVHFAGNSVFAVRVTLAVVAIAAVPLLYGVVRLSVGRVEALFASTLLALSYWHLLYSRVAHWSITYGTVMLAALLLVMLGLRSRRLPWFGAAGAVLGLGVYTYNIYPIALVAFAVFAAAYTFVRWRAGDAMRPWLERWGVCAACAAVLMLPMIVYVSDPDSTYWKHVDNYRDVGLMRSPEWREASTGGKVRLLAEQAGRFGRTYTYDADPDDVDGNGLRPVFDPLTLALLAAGVVLAVRRRREPMMLAALCFVLIVPLPAVLQRGSVMRQPVGAAPFAMFLAALPLAALWRAGIESGGRWRALPLAGVAAGVGLLAAIAVRDYFWTWRESPFVRFVYHAEITSASLYMAGLPDGTYVYLFSERHPLRLETRQFLAPGVRGMDRSEEFGGFPGGSIEEFDRSRPVAVVLLGPYVDLLPEIINRYPHGTARAGVREGRLEYYAYELPAEED